MSTIRSIFGKNNNVVVGAIHFPPLKGYPDFPGIEVALENALIDLRALEQGGVDGIIVENNYDIPHRAFVSPEVSECLEFLAREVLRATMLPVGISVLWNDFKTALSISKKLGLKFIRVPVFVDTVETNYGVMEAQADNVKSFQKKIDAEYVALFCDIHVKHITRILSDYTISESASMAITKGADALIITGRWTGEAPGMTELKAVRKAIDDFPILCGSGVDENNVVALFRYANGAIVSTSLKEGVADAREVNVKAYSLRIAQQKVCNLMSRLK